MVLPRARKRPRSRPNTRGFFIDADQRDTPEKILNCVLAFARIPRIEDALIKLGQRDYRQCKTLRMKLLNASEDLRVSVEVVNHPVRVEKITHRN